MNQRVLLVALLLALALGLSVFAVDAQGPKPTPPKPNAPNGNPGTAFTYQGQLKQNGALVNAVCDFQFGLWSTGIGGIQLGVTQTIAAVSVVNGVVSGPLNDSAQFGASAFDGSKRFLQVAPRCPSGSGNYVALTPRQQLTPTPYAIYAATNWGLGGNSGTQNGNFVGTTDYMTLTLGVNNNPIMRLTPDSISANIIGGYYGNSVDGGVYGSVIGGGGMSGQVNRIGSTFATVGGGYGNTVGNLADWATIAGGQNNQISSQGYYAAIGGGIGNSASAANVVIGGGNSNVGSATNATIGGGGFDLSNSPTPGNSGNLANGAWATIGGGGGNAITGTYSSYGTIAGGYYNRIQSGDNNTIGGGAYNNVVTTNGNVVGGGYNNLANGGYATVPGGNSNVASGAGSFAAGGNAHALNSGSFVFSDGTQELYDSTSGQFVIKASGGIWIGFAGSGPVTATMSGGALITTSVGAFLGAGGAWIDNSDRNKKENFEPANDREILARLVTLPVQGWNYKAEDVSIRHIGPMAQDMFAIFKVGEDETHIATLDEGGIAFSAIKGLYQIVQEKDAKIVLQQKQIDVLAQQNADINVRLAALEQTMKENNTAAHADNNNVPTQWLLFGGLLVVGLVVGRRHG